MSFLFLVQYNYEQSRRRDKFKNKSRIKFYKHYLIMLSGTNMKYKTPTYVYKTPIHKFKENTYSHVLVLPNIW